MERDSSLHREMALVLAGVLVLDSLFAGLLAALLAPWTVPVADALAGALGVGPFGPAVRIGALALSGVAVLVWAQLRYTRRQLLADVDASPATRDAYPDLLARVERLATLAGLTAPAVAVVDSDVPNCFTVGGVRGGTLVVSDGLLAELDGHGDRLDAVLAHELAHLANRDAAVVTLGSFLPTVAAGGSTGVFDRVSGRVVWAVAAVVGYPLAAGAVDAPLFSPRSVVAFVALVVVVVLMGGVALGALAVPMAALSRRLVRAREFAADRAGALLTGDPAALATVLKTLDPDSADRPTADARYDRPAASGRHDRVAALCLLPGGIESQPAGNAATDGPGVRTTAHPPTDERVRRLRELAADLET